METQNYLGQWLKKDTVNTSVVTTIEVSGIDEKLGIAYLDGNDSTPIALGELNTEYVRADNVYGDAFSCANLGNLSPKLRDVKKHAKNLDKLKKPKPPTPHVVPTPTENYETKLKSQVDVTDPEINMVFNAINASRNKNKSSELNLNVDIKCDFDFVKIISLYEIMEISTTNRDKFIDLVLDNINIDNIRGAIREYIDGELPTIEPIVDPIVDDITDDIYDDTDKLVLGIDDTDIKDTQPDIDAL